MSRKEYFKELGVRKTKEKEALILEYYGGELSCEICKMTSEHGRKFFEWHHKIPDPTSKRIGTMLNSQSWENIKEELSKCLCLCPNCHTNIHIETWGHKKGIYNG